MAPEAINAYGDALVRTTGSHGADIASQRLDELDRLALAHLLARRDAPSSCVDLGCGMGWQGVRFALLGANAALYDLMPPSELVRSLQQATTLSLRYVQADLADLPADRWPAAIDIVFSQRFLHYLPFAAAQRLLADAAGRLAAGARCFLSVSGLDTELGQGYASASAPIDSRFGPLAPAMISKHGIAEPVALYTEAEFVALAERCGLRARRVWASAFGNLKGVFVAAR